MVCLWFGKHKGQDLRSVPASYLRWLLRSDGTDPWLQREVQAELQRRGSRYVPAHVVLADLQNEIERRISTDIDIVHSYAGGITDHVLEACDAIRARWQIGSDTQLEISGDVRKEGAA